MWIMKLNDSMIEYSLEGVGRLSGGCADVVWKVWGGCLEGVGRLYGGCVDTIWMVWGGCVEGVGRLSGGCG